MSSKTGQLQIRVTPEQQAALRRLAESANQSVSAYVLGRALPQPGLRLAATVRALGDEEEPSYALAELNDLLSGLVPPQLADAVTVPPPGLTGLSPVLQCYVAAMVEQACDRQDVPLPGWVSDVPPLEEPYFAVGLERLRTHLLVAAPVPFKRRNIFVDAALGDRV